MDEPPEPEQGCLAPCSRCLVEPALGQDCPDCHGSGTRFVAAQMLARESIIELARNDAERLAENDDPAVLRRALDSCLIHGPSYAAAFAGSCLPPGAETAAALHETVRDSLIERIRALE